VETVVKAILISVLFISCGSTSLFAAQKQIDPEQSTLTIHVGKAGLLSVAGHEHTVQAPIAQGTIDDGAAAHVSFRVEAARLMVQPEEHRDEIQHAMQERVLESDRFPEIRFVSDRVQSAGDGKWDIAGTLMLHGESKPVQVHVQLLRDKYAGRVIIKQSDFGIQPVSAGGGTVKVKDELKIDFSIKTR
jgi:polyisoprenoid-binding protein YceI